MDSNYGHLLAGLLIGIAFGFILQKAQVTKTRVIVGQFLLKDFTVMKVMLSAIVVGGVGVYLLNAAGLVTLHPKPLQVGMILAGGAVFGIGMAVLGLCPGTCLAALGQGSRDALWGVFGMLAGGAIYAEVEPAFKTLAAWNNHGVVLLTATGVPWWVWFALVAMGLWVLRRAPVSKS